MYKNITLNEFIGELQKLAAVHGNDEISSIGSSSGKIQGMSSPFCFNFKGHDVTEFVPAYQHDIKPVVKEAAGEKQADTLRHVWARVGMTLDITPEEEKAIFEGDYLEGKAAVKQVVMDGRASLDGETYIPEECIEAYDEEYGTNYRNRDEECAWSLDGISLRSVEAPPTKVVDDLIAYGAKTVLANSREFQKEALIAAFVNGQEFYEKDTERFIALKAKGPFDVWVFDVFDKNKELLYETSEYAGRLANDILEGYIVPASMAKEKSVTELISDAAERSEKADVGESKEHDFLMD